MALRLEGREGLSLEVCSSGELVIARDGSSRVETWSTAEALAERLRALGVQPEQIDMSALHV